MKVPPYHSRQQRVHHDHDNCTEGNNIEPWNKIQGTGGKPLCQHCEDL